MSIDVGRARWERQMRQHLESQERALELLAARPYEDLSRAPEIRSAAGDAWPSTGLSAWVLERMPGNGEVDVDEFWGFWWRG